MKMFNFFVRNSLTKGVFQVLYLLNQIKNPVDLSSKDETERVKGLQKRIAFQVRKTAFWINQ